jgi:hypothetical protein
MAERRRTIAMRRITLSFRSKLIVLGTVLTGAPLVLFGAATWWQSAQFRAAAVQGSQNLAHADLDHIVQNVYRLCEEARASLERSLVENLSVASAELERAGNLHLDSGSTVSWEARNQFTKERRCG